MMKHLAIIVALLMPIQAMASYDAPLKNTVTQFDFGAKCDGSTDDTQKFKDWFNSGKTLLAVPGSGKCILSDTITMSTNKQTFIGAGAQLSWTSGITNKPGIAATGDDQMIDHIWGENANSLSGQSGERNYFIKATGNRFTVKNSYGDKFQNCGWFDYSASNSGFKALNNNCHDMTGAGDGQSSASSNGEDRGDAFYCGGSDCLIEGNTANCKAGSDCRVAFHAENIHPETSDHVGARIIGNHATGKFRRGDVCENMVNCELSANTGQDMTWWDVACIRSTNCGGTGNKFTYNRASTDNAGSVWSPNRGALMVYGKNENVSFDSSNQFNVTGYASGALLVQGLASGDDRTSHVKIGAQVTSNDNAQYCAWVVYSDYPTISPTCSGYKDYGLYSYDTKYKDYSGGYYNSVNKFQTKLILASITGTFTVGDTITQATSGAVGTLVYVDAPNKLLTVSQTFAQSSTAYDNTHAVSNAGSVGSGTVSRVNTYGYCLSDDNNAFGGKYDNTYCSNANVGKSIVNKTYVEANNDKFDNVVTAYDLFGSTNSTVGIGSTFNTVTTQYNNAGGSGNLTGASLVTASSTNTFTNKTFDTAGSGNVFKINGTTVSDKTGTGKAVLDVGATVNNLNPVSSIDTSSISLGANMLTALTSTGNGMVAIGSFALANCTGCDSAVAIGGGAMQNTTTGASGTAVGRLALINQTTGAGNVGIGYQAGRGVTTGSQNTAVGSFAMSTMGAAISGTNNSAFGYGSLVAAQGVAADNTAMGKSALSGVTTGTQNVGLGSSAGSSITTGSNNVAIGYNAQVASATGSNQLAIGTGITGSLTTGALTVGALNASSVTIGGTALANYTEGSFTPTVIGSSTAGTTTYTTQLGQYSRIGNVVFVVITLSWSAMTGTGDLQVGGLPFAPNATLQSGLSIWYNNLTVGAGKQLTCETSTSSSILLLTANDPSGGASANVGVDNSATLIISGFYKL